MANAHAQDAIREAITKWDEVYSVAIQIGPHNPAGSAERAEELTRAWMNGWIMTEEARHGTR